MNLNLMKILTPSMKTEPIETWCESSSCYA